MLDLPDNLKALTEIPDQGEPLTIKYSEADIIRGAYFLLLNELESPILREKILNKRDRVEVSAFAREVDRFSEDPENRAKIEKFLTNYPDKCKITQ